MDLTLLGFLDYDQDENYRYSGWFGIVGAFFKGSSILARMRLQNPSLYRVVFVILREVRAE